MSKVTKPSPLPLLKVLAFPLAFNYRSELQFSKNETNDTNEKKWQIKNNGKISSAVK